jgi:hypothetical protein
VGLNDAGQGRRADKRNRARQGEGKGACDLEATGPAPATVPSTGTDPPTPPAEGKRNEPDRLTDGNRCPGRWQTNPTATLGRTQGRRGGAWGCGGLDGWVGGVTQFGDVRSTHGGDATRRVRRVACRRAAWSTRGERAGRPDGLDVAGWKVRRGGCSAKRVRCEESDGSEHDAFDEQAEHGLPGHSPKPWQPVVVQADES